MQNLTRSAKTLSPTAFSFYFAEQTRKFSFVLLPCNNNFAGALGNAGKATRALGVINDGQIVYHGYSAVRAVLCAYAAAYAAHLALRGNFFCLAVGRASNINGSVCGNAFYNVLGARAYARPAGNAPFGYNFRNAVYHFNGFFGAYICAVAAAEASGFAHLVSAEQTVAGRAGGVALIFKCVEGICAAFALYNGNGGGFFLDLYAKNFSNFCLLFGRGYVAL